MKERISLFNLPNIFTACNMLSGVLAIVFVFFGRLDWAPWFIFLGAIFDWLDGFTARLLKQFSELGKQLDSLADMITFGLAPGVIMMAVLVVAIDLENPILTSDFNAYASYSLSNWKNALLFGPSKVFYGIYLWLPFIAFMIPVFSLFRLAKFNIDTRQNESFLGLPTPANTLFFMTYVLALSYYFSKDGYPSYFISFLFEPLILSSLILVMSYFLITEIPLFALKLKSFVWKGNELRYIFLLISIILIFSTGVWSIALIVLLYLILSIVTNQYTVNKKD
jgi:CDP-diacylglycerol--serine O-phosphatidyltransferase